MAAAPELSRFYSALDNDANAKARFQAIWNLRVDERPEPLATLGNVLGFRFTTDDVLASFEEAGLDDAVLTDDELELVSGGAVVLPKPPTSGRLPTPHCLGAHRVTCCTSTFSKCQNCYC